eukprot:gene12173-12259_t
MKKCFLQASLEPQERYWIGQGLNSPQNAVYQLRLWLILKPESESLILAHSQTYAAPLNPLASSLLARAWRCPLAARAFASRGRMRKGQIMKLNDMPLEIPRPKCEALRVEPVGWFKTHPLYMCESCGVSVSIDLDDLEAELAGAAGSLVDVIGMAGPKH